MYDIYLSNGYQISAFVFGAEPHFAVQVDDLEQLAAVWKQLTPENLATLEVYRNGTRFHGFTDAKLYNKQAVYNPDGSINATFYLEADQEESVSPDYKTAFEILMGEMA